MQAFDTLPCAVLVTDMQGRVLAANAELGTLSGRDGQAAQALTLERMDDLLPPASRIFMQTHVWPSLLRIDWRSAMCPRNRRAGHQCAARSRRPTKSALGRWRMPSLYSQQ